MAKKSYLHNQFNKFCRLNGIKWSYVHQYRIKGVGVYLRFKEEGYILASPIPIGLLPYHVEFPASSVPEIIYKLVKHKLLPIELTDFHYKPFNYTQTQLQLFTEYEEKIRELRRLYFLELLSRRVKNYQECALDGTSVLRIGYFSQKKLTLKKTNLCKANLGYPLQSFLVK